jgi:hypothetical protein
MGELVPFLVVFGPLAALSWFLGRRSGRRAHHPLWPAFTATAAATILVVAGILGYNLNTADAAAAGTPWSGRVLWWEVAVGLSLVPVAAGCWRHGIRSLNPGSPRGTRSTD